mgnify:CR=1 FL=1|jgi:hypothetical protein
MSISKDEQTAAPHTVEEHVAVDSVDLIDSVVEEIELVVLADDGTPPTPSSPKSSPHNNNPSHNPPNLLHSFFPPLLLYIALSTASIGLLILFSRFTTQQQATAGENFENFAPFELLRVQLLFYVGVLVGCAETAMRASANASGLLPTTRLSVLALIFVFAAVLVPAVPSISERPAPPIVVKPFRGGCSDDLPWSDVAFVCPPLARDGPHFLAVSEGTEGHVRDTYNSLERLQGAVRLIVVLQKYYKDNPDALDRFVDGPEIGVASRKQKAAYRFLDEKCLLHVVDWFFTRLLTPCRHDDCTPLNATVCSAGQMTAFLQCVRRSYFLNSNLDVCTLYTLYTLYTL